MRKSGSSRLSPPASWAAPAEWRSACLLRAVRTGMGARPGACTTRHFCEPCPTCSRGAVGHPGLCGRYRRDQRV
ncbi:hypothetical protein C8T65DRAFT_298491 [Cerioporus squamosus]|nr:hypothetical protein C8T65DRAFT_298491 [Cerioporus squamosus]